MEYVYWEPSSTSLSPSPSLFRFYGGYYLFFLTVPLISSLDKRLRKFIRPRLYTPESLAKRGAELVPQEGKGAVALVYTLVAKITTCWTINYYASGFLALSGTGAFALWRSYYFLGHIGAVAVHITLSLLSMAGFGPKAKTA
jgi:hypothetical protein